MKDKHEKIKGYRDLSQDEVDLMNRIKEHGEVTASLIREVREIRINDFVPLRGTKKDNQINESLRCLTLAKTHLQTGQMWFVRAIALPESF